MGQEASDYAKDTCYDFVLWIRFIQLIMSRISRDVFAWRDSCLLAILKLRRWMNVCRDSQTAIPFYFPAFYWNIIVLWQFIILLFNLDISYSIWAYIGLFTCLAVLNIFCIETKIDDIIDRHNALLLQIRLRNKTKMWIYIVLTGLSIAGLLVAAEMRREPIKVESNRDRLRIEIQDRLGSDNSTDISEESAIDAP